MKSLKENSVDSIVTDPPYGLSAAKNSGNKSKGGFMGKLWDYDVPSVEIWREALRVLKPGGHLLAFGGTRTYHRLAVNIEDAGFEVRDMVSWMHGQGFPKSKNIGDGLGTALKPALEPVCMARKPLDKGLTVAQNVQKYGTGALNIAASRIAGEPTKGSGKSQSNNPNTGFGDMGTKRVGVPNIINTQGRWPANVILNEEAGQVLDAQSGISGDRARVSKGKSLALFGGEKENEGQRGFADSGGASRFFYCAKASKRERGDANVHPTVKPIALMEYLIRLVTPPGGTVLDPFMGSGSTGVAARNLNFEFIGCELSAEYFEIAKRRIYGV